MKRTLLLTIILGAALLLSVSSAVAQRGSSRGRPGAYGQRPLSPRTAGSAGAGLEADVLADYTKLANNFVQESEEEKEVFFYSCSNVMSRTVRQVLESFLTPGGAVADNDETDVIAVSDTPANIEILRRIAVSVDIPVPQVLVEARIVELTIDSDFEKELNLALSTLPADSAAFVQDMSAVLGTPGANPNTTQGSLFNFKPVQHSDGQNTVALTTFLRYLQTKGRARILSSPSLILRRGTEGSIITGEEVPILTQTVTSGAISTSTEFKSVGIKLRVRPVMISGDRIRAEINPEVSTVTGFTSSGSGLSNPTIAVRNANTELETRDGQLVSIGGLYRTEEREVRRQVPILGSIPILGHLFRSTRKERVETQLVIFLTMHILAPEDLAADLVTPRSVPTEIQDEVERMSEDTGAPASDRDKASEQ
jgi:general secretion pathway protein D